MTPAWIFHLHLAATAIMAGVIWFVQLIQYPWFHKTPPDQFVSYHRTYTNRVGLIVGPAMMAELITAAGLVLTIEKLLNISFVASLILLAIIWASTAFIQIPCHRILSRGYDEKAHLRLVKSNWIRTAGWTGRLILLLVSAPV